jgi:intracellular multiplication protein IcmO
MPPRHEIHGPIAEAERSGSTLNLDTRPFLSRAAAVAQTGPVASAALLGGAVLMAVVPFMADIVLPVGLAFAAWVQTRPVRLPLHLPERSGRKDQNDLDPETRRPRKAQGRDYLGRERFTGRQIWQSMATSVQHRLLPGTTGAGKTETMIALGVANAIAQGSGCIMVDGKGDPEVYMKILALAHQAGREDDVQVLSFLGSDSNTTNPFAGASADMIREILVGQLNEPGGEGSSAMFFGRAVAFLGTVAPILRWLGDTKGIRIDLERIRDAIELPNIARMAQHREIKFRYAATNTEEIVSLDECPLEYIRGLENYLGDTGGFDLESSLKSQKSDEPVKQHSYIAMQFTEVFTQWLISLGHIFRVPYGDVDMFDVVMNRRILVVLLPSLKNSDKTTQGLGRYLVAMLKATMGLVLGGNLEGDYANIIENLPSKAPSAFKTNFDEVGAYTTNGMDKMLAMARKLNIEFNLGLQETASVRAAMGARAAAVLGNPNTVVAMRLQEPDTGEMVEKIGGETKVAQVSQQPASRDLLGTFRPAEAASILAAKRYNWLDLRNLKEGQAILSYGNTLVHTNMFYCPAPIPAQMRIQRLVMLHPPDRLAVLRHARQIEKTRLALLAGPEEPVEAQPPAEALLAMLDVFAAELDRRELPHRAALSAVLACPDISAGADSADDDTDPADHVHKGSRDPGHNAPEDHAFSDLLRAASQDVAAVGDFPDPGRSPEAEQAMVEELEKIERAGGRRGDAAKQAARQAIGGIRLVFGKPQPKPERISTHKLLGLINQMIATLDEKRKPEGE